MQLLFFVFIALFIYSCKNSAISKELSTADSLVVNFYAIKNDSVIKTVNTTEDFAVKKVAGFINNKKTEEFKCGYDGNLIFFSKGGLILPVVFKYKEAGCRHFLYEMDGKTISTKMNNEAADFLQG